MAWVPAADASAARVRAALVVVSATRSARCAMRRHWRCSRGVGGPLAVGVGLLVAAAAAAAATVVVAPGVEGGSGVAGCGLASWCDGGGAAGVGSVAMAPCRLVKMAPLGGTALRGPGGGGTAACCCGGLLWCCWCCCLLHRANANAQGALLYAQDERHAQLVHGLLLFMVRGPATATGYELPMGDERMHLDRRPSICSTMQHDQRLPWLL